MCLEEKYSTFLTNVIKADNSQRKIIFCITRQSNYGRLVKISKNSGKFGSLYKAVPDPYPDLEKKLTPDL